MNPIARNWKVPLPRLRSSNSLRDLSSPSSPFTPLQTPRLSRNLSSLELLPKIKVEKKEEKKEEKTNIDVVFRVKNVGEEYDKIWKTNMCSILVKKEDIIYVIPHLRKIPYFFKELGMLTETLDLVLDRAVKSLGLENITITRYYLPTTMIDDVMIDEIFYDIRKAILLLVISSFEEKDQRMKMEKVEVIEMKI